MNVRRQSTFRYKCPFCGEKSTVTFPSEQGWGAAACFHATGVEWTGMRGASEPIIVFSERKQVRVFADGKTEAF